MQIIGMKGKSRDNKVVDPYKLNQMAGVKQLKNEVRREEQ